MWIYHSEILFYLPIHHLVNIWVVSTFWLLGIMLLWTLFTNFCADIYFCFPCVYLGVDSLDYMLTLCLTFCRTEKLFSKVVVPCIFFLKKYQIWCLVPTSTLPPPQKAKSKIYHTHTWNICKMTSTYRTHLNLIKNLLKKLLRSYLKHIL